MLTPAEMLERSHLVVPAAEVTAAIARLAGEISARLADTHPLVITVMQGGLVFAGQLLPQLRFPLELDYVHATRYGQRTQGGELDWIAGPHLAPAGRTVLLVDDILDHGRTLAAIRNEFIRRGAARVLVAALAVKRLPQPLPIRADFAGVTVPDEFVFGCGMDAAGAWRNLPEIRALNAGVVV
jgi:hypoxanthine phosphoribosyltransferase